MSKAVTVQIVTYNNLPDLPSCLASVAKQTFCDVDIIIVDNASDDGSLDFVRANYPNIKIIANQKNMGFAAGHNQALRVSQSPFVLVLNPDIYLEANFIAELVSNMETNSLIGSLSGKLLKVKGDLKPENFTDIIDTTGIELLKNRQAIDRGQGQDDQGQYDNKSEIFGASGAAAFYRRQALLDIAWKEEIFDEHFFSYKEDVDLAWRLRLRDWKSYFVPQAVGYHRRTISQLTGKIKQDRSKRSDRANYLSYRNHLFLIYKNELLSNLFWWFPQIAWYELRKFVYLLIFEPFTLKGLNDFSRKAGQMKNKRKHIQSRKKASLKTIRSWFK
ncbi:MAG: glycosyltransferase family 2 protein [Patescibacteria group bacterium]